MEEELLKKWDVHQIIQEAIRTAHTTPSPETINRLKTLEDTQTIFMDKLDNLKEDIQEISISIAELPEKIFDKADHRYASKEIEEAVRNIQNKNNERIYQWLYYFVTALVGGIIALIISKYGKII